MAAAAVALDIPVEEDMIAIKVVEMPANGATNKLLFEWIVFSFKSLILREQEKSAWVFSKGLLCGGL